VSFEVSADAYAQFMGRYSEPLAAQFLGLVDVRPGQRALDVGCGPGALSAALVARLGITAVSAIDPSASFVAAISERFPGIDVHCTGAERLPFSEDSFDLTLAQLVVGFMTDPLAGIVEMGRVTRPGGQVAACVWDHAGSGSPLSLFWRAARELDPAVRDESALPGARKGHLAELFDGAGLSEIESTTLTIRAGFASTAQWWAPYLLGVGPAGTYVAGLDEPSRDALRAHCAALLPEPPFEITATAWAAVGRARR
jgi:SAM-dependent methyltransferase